MKKYSTTVFTIVIGLLILGGGAYYFLNGRNGSGGSNEQTSEPEVNAIIEDNPYFTLTPRADGHEFKLEAKNLNNTETLEYEFAYQAGEFARGAIGKLTISANTPVVKNLLLGSESCSGTGDKRVCKYRYDEGVTEGTLMVKLHRGSQVQKIEFPFHLQQAAKTDKQLTSKDNKFEYNGALKAGTYYVTHLTFGVPKLPSGKIVGGPYGIFTSGDQKVAGTVKIQLSEASPTAKILSWNETTSNWQELTGKIENNTMTATTDRLSLFVVVNP